MGVDDTDGEPLGCVRASFGYASRVSDAKAIIETIEREFVCHARMTDRGANEAPGNAFIAFIIFFLARYNFENKRVPDQVMRSI